MSLKFAWWDFSPHLLVAILLIGAGGGLSRGVAQGLGRASVHNGLSGEVQGIVEDFAGWYW